MTNIDIIVGENGCEYRVIRKIYDGHSDIYTVKHDNTLYVYKRFKNDKDRRECKILEQLQNNHIISIITTHKHNGSILGYIMPRFDYTLDQWYAPRLRIPSLVSLKNAFTQLCIGVAATHDKGYVHCDIKPQNILIDAANQRVVVADYTSAHKMSISFDYDIDTTLLPKNKPHQQYSPGSLDCYTIGIMLYGMFENTERMHNRNQFGGGFPTQQQVNALIFRKCHPDLQNIIRQCLMLEYRNAGELRRDLHHLNNIHQTWNDHIAGIGSQIVGWIDTLITGQHVWHLPLSIKQALWGAAAGSATWLLAQQLDLPTPAEWLGSLGSILIFLLSLRWPRMGALAAMMIHAIIIAHINLALSTGLVILAIGAALASRWANISWQLRMLALLPLLGTYAPALLVLPLALLVKPDALHHEQHQQTGGVTISSWPAASLIVLPAALLIGQALGCSGSPLLCLNIASVNLDAPAQALWPLPPLILDDQLTEFAGILAAMPNSLVIVAVGVSSLLETFSRTLIWYLPTNNNFLPVQRLFMAATALILIFIGISGGIYYINGQLWDYVLNYRINLLNLVYLPWILIFLIVIAYLYDPSDDNNSNNNNNSRSAILLTPFIFVIVLSMIPWIGKLIAQ